MGRTKVCILQFGFARGGTDTFVINLCRNIDKSKFDVTVVNPGGSDLLLSREKEVTDTGVKIHHTTEMYSLIGKVKHLWQLYKFLKKNRFDTFQSNVDLFNGPQMFVAWAAGVPNRVCHSHNTRQARDIASNNSLGVWAYQGLMRFLCKNFATRYCGCSEEAMTFLFHGFDWRTDSYPQIIYNGIDQTKFLKEIDVVTKKKEIGLVAPKNILVVGHIGLQKNPHLTVKIFNEIGKKRDDVDLVWIGKGEMEHEIYKEISDYGFSSRVHFLGHRSDVAEIMKCCDLFLFPSLFEGLGIVLIEAQASGLPCLASDQVPSIANCGAVLFKKLDSTPEDWAITAIKILDKDIQLSVDIDKLSNFTIENMTAQMQKVLTPDNLR